MRRIARAMLIVGGTAALVALPREDYARFWAKSNVVAHRAAALINKHIVQPIRVAATGQGAPQGTADQLAVPAPRPVIRPSLLDGTARSELAAARISQPQKAISDATGEARTAVRDVAFRPDEVPENKDLPGDGVGTGSRALSVGADPDRAVKVVAPQETAVGISIAMSQAATEPTAPSPSPAAEKGRPVPLSVPVPVPAKVIKAADQSDKTSGSTASGMPPLPVVKPEVPEEKRKPVAAKLLFGHVKAASPLKARAIGFYSRGCLSGGRALPVDGPAWQAMRLSRNRNWGHPKLIALIERFAKEVQKEDGWPGLLVGDISQPRGGPMLTGHASHQVGLDADIWFTPMPGRRLSRRERERLSATSMIDGPTKVDPKAFTPSHIKVVKRAASYPDVERILVHPAIKKALCEGAGSDRAWLGKVRPYYGHHYHFHVRLRCPHGSPNCRAQRPPSGEDGCGKELDYWFRLLTRPPRPKPKTKTVKKRKPKPPITLADLPPECKAVLSSGENELVQDRAELIKTSIERSRKIIDISGKSRAKALADKAKR